MFITSNEADEKIPAAEEKLRHIADTMLKSYDASDSEFSLVFTTAEEIRELNRTYREVDSVTDVLTFCSGGEIDPETGHPYLGDILICTERAKEQAELSGHGLEDEISLLLIHGILHLMDYDHDTDEKKAEMWQEQDHFLDLFSIQLKRRPGEDFDF